MMRLSKTAELTGAELDYWVARAEVEAGHWTFDTKDASRPLIQTWCDGSVGHTFSAGDLMFAGQPGEYIARGCSMGAFEPSIRWDFGGPIIEREKIRLCEPDPKARHADPSLDGQWQAMMANWETRMYNIHPFGPTPLVAAMRAYVASRFGDEVPPCP